MNRAADQTIPTAEVLAPAGSFAALKAAVAAGADAVYVSGKRYGARAYADNFTQEELREALDYVHLRGRRLHLTVNTLMREEELGKPLYAYLAPLVENGLDAVIVQDPGVLETIRQWFPELPVHASTQMSVTSRGAARMLRDNGVSRVIPARELSLEEIAAIADLPSLEVEAFVHGAMCYAYSGKCLFSSTMGERSGNRGTCAQPCRLPYRTETSKKERYLLSMQDLCAVPLIPDLIRAGVCSFKIEGRMKDAGYVSAVTALYRRCVDRALRESGTDLSKELQTAKRYARRISGTGYLQQRNGPSMITPDDPSYRTGNKERESAPQNTPTDVCQVDASLTIRTGQPAELTLSYDGHTVTAKTEEAAAPAKKAPLGAEAVCERLQKRDQWPFVLRWEQVDMADDLFLPVSALNALRREAFARLGEAVLAGWRRERPSAAPTAPLRASETRKTVPQTVSDDLRILVSTAEQLEAVMQEPAVSLIYIESTLLDQADDWAEQVERAHSDDHPKQIWLALPHIYRPQGDPAFVPAVFTTDKSVMEAFDGFLARNLDELAWLREQETGRPVCTDYLLYAFNSRGIDWLGEQGAAGVCYSPEMSRHDIGACEQALEDRSESISREIPVYGKTIRMLSAQCVVKNTGNCTKNPVITRLTDRRGVKFDVHNRCDSCYNIVYNSVPVSLHKKLAEIRALQGLAMRLDFTGETAAQTRQIITLFSGRGDEDAPYEYTKGHFERSIL